MSTSPPTLRLAARAPSRPQQQVGASLLPLNPARSADIRQRAAQVIRTTARNWQRAVS